jgi:RNA polymerase sigma-70 factor, ECF subfamily
METAGQDGEGSAAATCSEDASPSDADLIVAVNSGDLAAFEAIYRRYRDWVVHLAHRFTGDEGLALDVSQETFVYFLRKFPGFRLTAHLKTFLYPAVKNLAIAARRKRDRYQTGEEGEYFLETLASPEPSASRPNGLAAVLAGLPEEQREVLLLRFVDSLSLAEIAGAMAIPLGTVKSRLHNALATLRSAPRTRAFFES